MLKRMIWKINAFFQPCQFCQTRKKLKKIIAILETVPEIGSALYDDQITDAYNAVDDALSTWRCYCGEKP